MPPHIVNKHVLPGLSQITTRSHPILPELPPKARRVAPTRKFQSFNQRNYRLRTALRFWT